jgi:hypothetical protein
MIDIQNFCDRNSATHNKNDWQIDIHVKNSNVGLEIYKACFTANVNEWQRLTKFRGRDCTRCCFRHFQNSIKMWSFVSVYSNILYQFFLLSDGTFDGQIKLGHLKFNLCKSDYWIVNIFVSVYIICHKKLTCLW